MHVAYIHQHFTTPTGYSGTRSYEMSQRLLRARHRVTMIAGAGSASNLRFDPGKRVTEQEVDGIHVLGVSEPYANVMTYARRILAFGRFARTATRLVRSLDADLVFATSTPLTVGLPGMKGAKALGVPFVFEVRDLWPELPIVLGIVKNPLLVWYLKRMERRIYQAAHRIVALSPGVRDGICRTGYPAERVTMIPNSADTTLFRPAADKRLDARFGPPEDFRLVFTGAHGPANGLDAVLDAAVVLRRRNVRGIRFVFIGWGRERERLIQRSRSDGTIDTISWLKAMPKRELAAILPRMDVGMMILKNVPAF
ncbi:MAG: glycosyltransferase family 4 protein, partial [Phycisphaerae bacterium]